MTLAALACAFAAGVVSAFGLSALFVAALWAWSTPEPEGDGEVER